MENNKIVLNYTVRVLPFGSTYTQIENAVKKLKETKEKELFDLDLHCKFDVKVNVELSDVITIGFKPNNVNVSKEEEARYIWNTRKDQLGNVSLEEFIERYKHPFYEYLMPLEK